MASHKLFKHFGVVAALTMVSRVLGVVRDMACAAFFGAGMVWDAFSFAFRVPNLFRRLFGEGALQAAFIPVFSEYLENKREGEIWRLASLVGVVLALTLLALLLLGEGFLLALPHLTELSDRWQLTLVLTAVLLPYMLFICLTALAGAALNSLKHFTAPALAPVVLNACWIAAVVVFAPMVSTKPAEQIFVVAVGILAAGVLQLALQVGTLFKKGFQWLPNLNLKHPGLRRIVMSMVPVALGLAAFQINVLLDGVIAITLAAPEGTETFTLFGATVPYPMEVGANSVLYYGNRLMQFPLGVFGIALATAVFPHLSSYAAKRDWDGFSDALTQGLGAVLFIGVPAGVGLILLRNPAIQLLFERGAFTREMTLRTAGVLTAYCTATWAYCAHQILIRAFYGLQDTRTPARVAAAMVAVNLTLNLTLIWPLAEAGLAAATACSGTCQAAVLYVLLHRRLHPSGQKRLLTVLWKTALATALMSFAVIGTLVALPAAPETDRVGLKILRLAVPLAAGLATYMAVAWLVKLEGFIDMIRQVLPGVRST